MAPYDTPFLNHSKSVHWICFQTLVTAVFKVPLGIGSDGEEKGEGGRVERVVGKEVEEKEVGWVGGRRLRWREGRGGGEGGGGGDGAAGRVQPR